MIVYAIMLMFSIIMLFVAEKYKDKKKIRIIAFILAALSFFLISALRYDLGTDYIRRYARDYIRIANGIDVKNLEIGFKLLIQLCILFSKDYIALFIVTSGIMIFFTFYIIYKESPYPILSVLIYFCLGYFFHSLNIMREFLAISILLCSYKFLVNKKYIRFGIFALIAILLHTSSIVFLIAIFLCNKEVFNLKRTVIITLLVIIFGKYLWPLISTNIISKTRFAMYIGSQFDFGVVRKTDIIVNFLLYILIYYLYKTSADVGRKEKFFLNMQACTLIFTAGASMMYLILRLSFYFSIFNMISIPYFLKKSNIEINKKKILMAALLVLLIFNIYKRNIIKNVDEVVPYKTIFSEEKRFEKDWNMVINEEKRKNKN